MHKLLGRRHIVWMRIENYCKKFGAPLRKKGVSTIVSDEDIEVRDRIVNRVLSTSHLNRNIIHVYITYGILT